MAEIENPHDDGNTAGTYDELIDSGHANTSFHDNHAQNLGHDDKIDW